MAGIGGQIHERVKYQKNDKKSPGRRHEKGAGKLQVLNPIKKV